MFNAINPTRIADVIKAIKLPKPGPADPCAPTPGPSPAIACDRLDLTGRPTTPLDNAFRAEPLPVAIERGLPAAPRCAPKRPVGWPVPRPGLAEPGPVVHPKQRLF